MSGSVRLGGHVLQNSESVQRLAGDCSAMGRDGAAARIAREIVRGPLPHGEKLWLTADETTRLTGVTRQTLYSWIKKYGLKNRFRDGRRIFFAPHIDRILVGDRKEKPKSRKGKQEWLTVREAASEFDVPESTLRFWLRKGRVQFRRRGRLVFFEREPLTAKVAVWKALKSQRDLRDL